VPSLDDVVRSQTSLSREDLGWLRRLVADWQIIADLSFADLVLWLPDVDGHGFWAGAQMRPTTGPTALLDDVVGSFVPRGRRPLLDSAWEHGRIVREGDPEWRDAVPVRVETIPVRRAGRVLGVIARNTNLLGVRTPSRLELSYLQTAADLTTMISEGEFPLPEERSDLAESLRVGDGFVRVGTAGEVLYASPNAVSALRRLGLVGDVVGRSLTEVMRALVHPSTEPVDTSVNAMLAGVRPGSFELANGAVSLVLRALPLRAEGAPTGGLVLMRDVTELRSRERELMTKEATIREIHHRVKNNLQTVAALLRLQARRIPQGEGRLALEEAVTRVGTIAVVHETLSQAFDENVEFDEVADRLRTMVVEVSSSGARITTERVGSFGVLPAEVATPLAMVLTEMMQNAVEHGFVGATGHLQVLARRTPGQLQVTVVDDGAGLPDDFDPSASRNLGVSIMTTLVEGDLGGRMEFRSRDDGRGAAVSATLPLSDRGAPGPRTGADGPRGRWSPTAQHQGQSQSRG
jgi:two-component sensor histidine kinase